MGEEDAFKIIFDAYFRRLCYYARKHNLEDKEAESLVNDVLVNVFNDARKALTIDSPKELHKLIFRSTKNAIIRNYPLNGNLSKLHNNNLKIEEPQSEKTENFNLKVEIEMLQNIYDAVEKLPPEYKTVFKLSYLENHNIKQIAEILNISVDTVRSNKASAIKFIKQLLTKSPLVVAGLAISVLAIALFLAWLISPFRV